MRNQNKRDDSKQTRQDDPPDVSKQKLVTRVTQEKKRGEKIARGFFFLIVNRKRGKCQSPWLCASGGGRLEDRWRVAFTFAQWPRSQPAHIWPAICLRLSREASLSRGAPWPCPLLSTAPPRRTGYHDHRDSLPASPSSPWVTRRPRTSTSNHVH